MDIWAIITVIFFVIFVIVPIFRRQALKMRRVRALRGIERERSSRVITLIHRQEALGFLGIALYRYINIEDAEQILRAIRFTPDDMPIDLIVHTPGGLVLPTEQITHAIKRHKAKVTFFVPHYAMSGGTLLALAADEIVMSPDAVLGALEPQLGMNYPATSLVKLTEIKDRDKIDDETLIMVDTAQKAIVQMRTLIHEILVERMGEEEAGRLATLLTEGRWTHDYPLTVERLAAIGIPVTVDIPNEVYELMELYPQPGPTRPGVSYIPIPYERREREPRPGGKRS